MTPVIPNIVVDLDGTLVRSDLFVEAILNLIKKNPLNLLRVLWWLSRGIAYAKEQVAQRVDLHLSDLPIETALIDYLKEQRARGRRLILATASHRKYAYDLAGQLDIFDGVLATEGGHNLKGGNKLAAIQETFGGAAFSYAGDSPADRPIWRAASGNIFVNGPYGEVKAAQAAGKLEMVIVSRPPQWRAFLKGMRPHQYAKNALIFVPLFASYEPHGLADFVATLLAFVCFSLCASGVYFLNDLLDLAADRRHSLKRRRPLASGDLTLRLGMVGALALPLLSFVLASLLLPGLFILVLAVYYLLTNAYSFYLKRVSTADVMTLAILYTLRVVAGAAATGIVLSSWLLAFSVFVFVSLGYLKRYIEVVALPEDEERAPGRGYSGADRETMFSLGIANITASVVILALYINSPDVSRHYQTPELLWLLCLLMLYWGNRIWVGARRGKINDDPVVFALRDSVSFSVGMGFVLITLVARYITI